MPPATAAARNRSGRNQPRLGGGGGETGKGCGREGSGRHGRRRCQWVGRRSARQRSAPPPPPRAPPSPPPVHLLCPMPRSAPLLPAAAQVHAVAVAWGCGVCGWWQRGGVRFRESLLEARASRASPLNATELLQAPPRAGVTPSHPARARARAPRPPRLGFSVLKSRLSRMKPPSPPAPGRKSSKYWRGAGGGQRAYSVFACV
jgi:hypothetical protein